MHQLLGEYDCKLDSKGRFRVPAGLLKQLSAADKESFVLNRGFENCLVLRPKLEWDRITTELNKLSTLKKNNRDFIRYFHRGATELRMDASERLLLPRRLTEYAAVEKEVVLVAYFKKIEIWSTEVYEQMLAEEPEDFSSFTEGVFDGDENININI